MYTDNSSVCTAAFTRARSSTRTAGSSRSSTLPGQASYTGSTRNGITSVDWGAWPGSFKIVSAVKGSDVAGREDGRRGLDGERDELPRPERGRYRYICPGRGARGVYGTNTYTDDSSACTAAVQLGLFTLTNGGRVTIQIGPRQARTGHDRERHHEPAVDDWARELHVPGALPIRPGGGGGGGGDDDGGGGPPRLATGTATGTVPVNGGRSRGGTIPSGATVDVTNGRLMLRTDTGTLTLYGAGLSATSSSSAAPTRRSRSSSSGSSRATSASARSARRAAPRRRGEDRASAVGQRQGQLPHEGSLRVGHRSRHDLADRRPLRRDVRRVREGVDRGERRAEAAHVTVRAPRSYLATPRGRSGRRARRAARTIRERAVLHAERPERRRAGLDRRRQRALVVLEQHPAGRDGAPLECGRPVKVTRDVVPLRRTAITET